ncbi:hypothetical protein Thiowin_00476 [Thiorhodovibrio winogradskyi]|uniref:DUF927 domain-containing protein n=1 Tax=Thiorhodovibrio winogradskyi TaxID=77007 RepID=A0ABZ0S321_9GAMM|nr:hypothetical protein [Thiorhodovibrio winogradskyi]
MMQLSRSKGPASNTALEPWAVDFAELAATFQRTPRIGRKDGSYFVRGPFAEGYPSRADAHITEAALLILDGDKTVDPDSGEISEGAPHPMLVHEALKALDIPHLIYSSWSHGQPGKGNKFRALIPAAIPDGKTLSACIEWTLDRLHADGIWLADVKENHAWSQAWYFPRKANAEAETLVYVHDTEEVFDVGACIAWKAAQDPVTPQALEAAALASPPRGAGGGLFGQYNAKHGNPNAMLAVLVRKGYQSHGQRGTLNGEPVYRLLAPGSTSNAPGVALYKARDGRWLVASHHGEHDPLSQSPSNDAFDLFRLFEHDGDQAAALNAWRAILDPRPVIRITGGALPRNIKAAAKALAASLPPAVYQRGQTLCRVAHLQETGEIQGCTIPRGTAIIVTLQRPGLMVELGTAAKWERKNDVGEWYEVDPCAKVTAAMLEAVGQWGKIPSLLGISEAPILRTDGTLHAQAGYDPATRLYVEGRFPALQLPDRVTLDDAQRAAAVLLSPFLEFPFIESRLDHAVLLGYLFTLALRPQLQTAPLFCVSATTPGTGKGLLIEAANLLVRGRDAALMPAIQGTSAEEETRKRITALLLQGVSSINLDNWTRPIGGEAMNALLTTGEWSDRILGRSETVSLPARLALAATGNNLSVRGDMTRRSLLIQLDAGVERPELRTFKEPNLVGTVTQRCGELLTALFTILKGYQQAGRPRIGERLLGRFEPWSMAVAAPIRWLGYPDPTDSQARLREADPEADKLELLLSTWFDLNGGQWITAAELIQAAEPANDFSTVRTDKRDALREALLDIANDGRGRINRKALGWYLRHFEGRIAGGLRLVKKQRPGNTKVAHQYRVAEVADSSIAATGTDDG